MKALLRVAIGFGLMAGFLYWAFRGIDADGLWAAARSASPAWLAAMVAMIVVTAFLRGWRWVVLLRPVAPTVTVVDAALALAICYSVNIAIPRAGEAARALSLKWRHGASVSATLGTVFVERVLDLMWLILFIGISVLLVPGRIEQTFPWMRSVALATLAGCVLALAGMLVVSAYGDRGVVAVKRVLSRLSTRLADPVGDMLEKFIHGLAAVRTPSAYAEIIASSCLLNLGYCGIIYLSYKAFGFDEPPLGLGAGEALVIMAISSIGVVLPTPGGTGSYHFFFGHSLKALFAVPEASAMACATVVHAISNLTYLAFGVPALILQRRRRAERPSPTPSLAQEMAGAGE